MADKNQRIIPKGIVWPFALLTCLFFGLIPFWVMYILRKDMPMTWSICLIVSITVLAAAIIFKGRTVAREFQRRFHI